MGPMGYASIKRSRGLRVSPCHPQIGLPRSQHSFAVLLPSSMAPKESNVGAL